MLSKENNELVDANISRRIALNRSDQHLTISNNLRMLKRDVSRISILGKTKVESLIELENRVQAMRKQLQKTTLPTVEEDMSRSLSLNTRGKVGANIYSECARCKLRILMNMMQTHTYSCEKISPSNTTPTTTALETESLEDFISLTKFLPQPPRNIRLYKVGSTVIEWRWDAPVLGGGLPILDYHIKYKIKMIETDENTGETSIVHQVKDFIKTSHWCLAAHPVANKGYKLTNLSADSEYYDFFIRSVNSKGVSEWVTMLNEDAAPGFKNIVTTEDPDPPTPPQFLTVTKITSSCLYLRWSAPFYMGGMGIVRYIISYVVLEREMAVTSREILEETTHSFKSRVVKGSNLCEGVIRDLPPASAVKNVAVTAVNSAGLNGRPAILTLSLIHI